MHVYVRTRVISRVAEWVEEGVEFQTLDHPSGYSRMEADVGPRAVVPVNVERSTFIGQLWDY